MFEHLKQLEDISRSLDTQGPVHAAWFSSIEAASSEFLENNKTASAYNSNIELPAFLNQSISEDGSDFDSVLTEFFDVAENSEINACSGRFFGYVPGGGIPTAAFADFAASITNRYAGVYGAGSSTAAMENHLIENLCNLMGLPDTAHGTLLSGGTLSTRSITKKFFRGWSFESPWL